jgi:DNA modification methylase
MSQDNNTKELTFKGCHFRLDWAGKQSIKEVKDYPVEFVQKSGKAEKPNQFDYETLNKNWSNLLFHGDNSEVLHSLLANGFRGKIDLIYIDPPFDSAADYVKKVELKGKDSKTVEQKELFKNEQQSVVEQTQYTDLWKGSEYLQFMFERLILLRELLSEQGSIYLHCDWHKSHHLRFLLDEVFGEDNFINEIVWENQGSWIEPDNKFPNRHNNIYIYSKNKDKIFNRLYEADFSKSVNYQRWSNYIIDNRIYGNNYPKSDSRFNPYYNKFVKENNREPVDSDIIVDFKGDVLGSMWYLKTVDPKSSENTNYPTQKPEALLERIIMASSNPDSIVLDCFMGSGTTVAVAQKLGRRWIGADLNKIAVQTTIQRMSKIWNENKMGNNQGLLHYKVGSYDFQDEQNLIAIASEFYGIEKSTHAFFDSKIGEVFTKTFLEHSDGIFSTVHLKKITDYLMDNNWQKNPDFTNDEIVKCQAIRLVVNGITHEALEKIEAHNTKTPYTHIQVLNVQESGMKNHKEPEAKFSYDHGILRIENYISYAIIETFKKANKLDVFEISDFKSMIEYVLIDTNYDGMEFNICVSDIPKNKKSTILGEYMVDNSGKLAVKIISVLGEENLFVIE